MFDNAPPELVAKLVARIDVTINAKSGHDAWKTYLNKNAAAPGTRRDQEIAFLRSKGGTGNTLNDVANSYLNSKGYTGSFSDKVRAFCNTASTF